jgi:hypothetical protein
MLHVLQNDDGSIQILANSMPDTLAVAKESQVRASG